MQGLFVLLSSILKGIGAISDALFIRDTDVFYVDVPERPVILSIMAGCFAVMHPVFTMITLGYIIAFNVIMQGINMVVL